MERLCRVVEKYKVLYAEKGVSANDVEKAWKAVATEINQTVRLTKIWWSIICEKFNCFLETSSTYPERISSEECELYSNLNFLLPHLNNAIDRIDNGNTNSRSSLTDQKANTAKKLTTEILDLFQTSSDEELNTERKKLQTSTFSEPRVGISLPSRRVVVDTAVTRTKPPQELLESQPTVVSTQPVLKPNYNTEGGGSVINQNVQGPRCRSSSKIRLIFNDSEDTLICPPPCKKAAIANEAEIQKTVIAKDKPIEVSSRTCATCKCKSNENLYKESKIQATADFKPLDLTIEKTKVKGSTAIDVFLLPATAVSEVAAGAQEKTTVAPISVKSTETAVQCLFSANDEDEEFLQRLRKWLQAMNQRQKIVFQKGVLQAYLDVYDDPQKFTSYFDDARNDPNQPKSSHESPLPNEMRSASSTNDGCDIRTAANFKDLTSKIVRMPAPIAVTASNIIKLDLNYDNIVIDKAKTNSIMVLDEFNDVIMKNEPYICIDDD